MSDQDAKAEVDVVMEVSSNSKTITLTMTSPDPFTVQSFIMELETYLHEINMAADQMSGPGVEKH